MTDSSKPSSTKPLRSQKSYGGTSKDSFIHRSWMKSQGLPDEAFDGRPIIGICNTWSELTPCNAHLREIAESVKNGVWEAGGVPLEFPVMSLGETQMRPTAMLYRNLLSMDVEESLRGNPLDGVVLLGGCDKTTPGQLLGAASVDLPTMVISSGPMLNGKYRGTDIGSGTDVWKFSEAVRAGNMTRAEFMSAERGMSRTPGTCMTMGSASTVACLVEAMGLSMPYNATIPAVDAQRKTMSHLTGRRIVDLVKEDITLSQLVTRESFENAIKVLSAIGGSTNAVIHLLALAGRLEIDLSLEDFDKFGAGIPLLTDIQPSGRFLMEDFHYAGGLPVVLNHIREHLHLDVPTVSGATLGEMIDGAECYNSKVIRTMGNAVKPDSGIWVLQGNLCPDGAVMKPSAASPELFQHKSKAMVFDSIEDYKARIDSADLEVDKNTILVLRGCGPKGYPGMPEVGNMALPEKLLQQGVEDMLRISDARMSGTAFGSVILHVAPEANAGGNLALVKTGDIIEFDGLGRRLNLLVSDEELAVRRKEWEANKPESPYQRGYYKLYVDHVMQADKGADMDFLVGKSSHVVDRESH
jgi:dihydroxy-acid dehydratase